MVNHRRDVKNPNYIPANFHFWALIQIAGKIYVNRTTA